MPSWSSPGEYTYSLPSDGLIKIVAAGAPGGNGSDLAYTDFGGDGHEMKATFFVSDLSGSSLTVRVGGDGQDGSAGGGGGYNGGGRGYNSSGGGGGASDARDNDGRIIVGAGAGGGAAATSGDFNDSSSAGAGGNGGYPSGQKGEPQNDDFPEGGGGGTQSSGGAGGRGNLNGQDGSFGNGGNGGDPGGAGGGAGIHGGGGGSGDYTPVRAAGGGGGGASFASSKADSFSDNGLNYGSGYVEITEIPPPNAPSISVGTVGLNQIRINWAEVSDADSYDVYRDGSFLANVTTADYIDSGLNSATQYSYYVVAKNEAGESNGSNTVTATTGGSATQPSSTATADTIDLSWSVNGGGDIVETYVDRDDGTGFTQVATVGASTSFSDTGLTNGKQYGHRVRVEYTDAEASPSTASTATTALPATNFDTVEEQ
jgi:hypothetical protein